jgi:hypothetical protein
MKHASLRSKNIGNSPESFSLNIRRLAELIDMFHTRKATDVRDKAYALYGMSSDDLDKAGLRPNYDISWEVLFKDIVKFVFGNDVTVETSNNTQRAEIKSKGCVLGQVTSVRSDNEQNVNIKFKHNRTAQYPHQEIKWSLLAPAKSIQELDIVCLLRGALQPTIIRLCKDYFAIIVAAVTPIEESGRFKQLELSNSITNFPRDFLLVWDWEQLLGELQDQEESKNWALLDKETRIWNVALVLGDLGEYEMAETRLREAMKGYVVAFGEACPSIPKSRYGLTPLLWAAGNGYNVVVNLLLTKDGIDPDLKDSQYGQTPLLWAAE